MHISADSLTNNLPSNMIANISEKLARPGLNQVAGNTVGADKNENIVDKNVSDIQITAGVAVTISGAKTDLKTLFEPPVVNNYVYNGQESENDAQQSYSDKLRQRFDHNRGASIQGLLSDTHFLKGQTSFTQSAISYNGSAKTDSTEALIDITQKESTNQLTLNLTTKSGKSVSINIDTIGGQGLTEKGILKAFSGVEVTFSSSEELSEQEQESFALLVQEIDEMVADYQSTSEVDFSKLTFFEQDQFSNLSINSGKGLNVELKLRDDGTKVLDAQLILPGTAEYQKEKIHIDSKENFSSLDNENRQQSMDHYLNLIKDSVHKAHGSQEKARMMVTSFELMLSEPIEESSKALNVDKENVVVDASQILGKQSDQKIAQRDKGLLTGLADFNFEFKGSVDKPMDNQFFYQTQGFNLDLAQKTEVTDDYRNRNITQKQEYNLDASFFTPLGTRESPDFHYGNYEYNVLELEKTNITSQQYKDGVLEQALIMQSQDSYEKTVQVENWKIIDEKETQSSKETIDDVTEEIKQQKQEQPLELLDSVLIDLD